MDTNNDTSKIKVDDPEENLYERLRNIALYVTPEKLKLSLPADETIVFGVIMDWEIEDMIVSTVAYLTGDASLYFSTGQIIIGGGQHENVREASIQFVSFAETFLDKATKTQKVTLPTKDQVKFYLLTNNGIYVGQDIMNNLEDYSSEWSELFEEGNNVMTELRLIVEKYETIYGDEM